MKNLILLIGLLLAAGAARAQTTWAPPGAKWTYHYRWFSAYGVFEYTYDRDTVLLGHACKILKGRVTERDASAPALPAFTEVRDEQITYADQDRVYWWRDGRFYKLYDFAARPGDTWRLREACTPGSIQTGTMARVRVDSVGIVRVGGQTLRWFTVSVDSGVATPNTYWWPISRGRVIERLGSVAWLLPTTDCSTDPMNGDGLACYTDGTGLQYGTANCASVILSTNELLTPGKLVVAPNPAADGRFVLNGLTAPLAYDLYDRRGARVRRGQATPDHPGLDLGALPAGLYLLRGTTPDGRRLSTRLVRE